MNMKTVKAAPMTPNMEFHSEWAEFRIKGLEHIQGDEFRIEVTPLVVDWRGIEEQLLAAGVEKYRAAQYVEQFAYSVRTQELAHMLAERMERIG